MQMQKGGKYVMTIPSERAYGAEAKVNPQTGQEVIPANSDLVFDVELIDFMSLENFQARMAEMQQMQQIIQQQQQQMQQQGAPGVPGAPPAPPQP